MNSRKISGPLGVEQSPHLDENSCLDLLHGLVPAEQRDRYLAHLGDCPACEQVLRSVVAEREHTRAVWDLRVLPNGRYVAERLGEPARRQVADETTGPGASKWRRLRFVAGRPRLRWAFGLAAAVTVVFLALWPVVQPAPDSSLLQVLPSYAADVRFRDAVDALDNADLTAGLQAYAAGDLGQAIELLGRAEVTGPIDTVRKLYLGNALAFEGQFHRAVQVLENEASGTLPDPWGSEARWTLFVALRASQRQASADSVLKVLAAEPGEIGDRARTFLAGGGNE